MWSLYGRNKLQEQANYTIIIQTEKKSSLMRMFAHIFLSHETFKMSWRITPWMWIMTMRRIPPSPEKFTKEGIPCIHVNWVNYDEFYNSRILRRRSCSARETRLGDLYTDDLKLTPQVNNGTFTLSSSLGLALYLHIDT